MIKETQIITTSASNPTIYFLKGLPGSGKSTWAMANGENLNAIRINKDALRVMMGLPYTKENEGAIVHASREMGKEALRRGLSVIVDDTNISQKHLNSWMNIANDKSIKASFKEIYFDVPLKTCIERDAIRKSPVGEVTILKMWESLTGGICDGTHAYTKQEEVLQKAIIVDIDGTLALANGRNIYDDSMIHTDVVHEPVKWLINQLYWLGEHKDDISIIFLTGREGTDTCRKATNDWLEHHSGVMDYELIMRPEGDHRKDSIVKIELYNKYVKDSYNVKLWLDDRDSVVSMVRKDLKIPCFQVWYGDF